MMDNHSHSIDSNENFRSKKYFQTIQLEAEPDETSTSSTEHFTNEVFQLAMSLVSARQPVQHPAGNGSPEHTDLSQLQQVHLPPNAGVTTGTSNQSLEFCPYHSQTNDPSSFFLSTGQYSSNGVMNGSQNHQIHQSSINRQQLQNTYPVHTEFNRSTSTPQAQYPTRPDGLDRHSRSSSVPSRPYVHHPLSSNNMVQNGLDFPSTALSSTYSGTSQFSSTQSGLNDMTGLQHSLSGIQSPEDIQRVNETGSRSSTTESDASDDMSFRTVHPSYEGEPGGSLNLPEKRAETVRSISAQVSHARTGSNAKTTSTQPFPLSPHLGPAPPAISSSSTNRTREPKATVFITYADEPDKQHIRTVVQISQTLMKNSIDISVDMLEETMRSMSISDWLEDKMNKCDFVLICISPGYKQMIDMEDERNIDQRSMEKTLNTKYIYRRIHTEYIRNGSKNYRFIPVLLSGGKRHHIPHWLCDTKVYEWPAEYEDIIFRLYRMEKFVKPALGDRPQHTVEHYDSFSSQGPSSRNSSTRKK